MFLRRLFTHPVVLPDVLRLLLPVRDGVLPRKFRFADQPVELIQFLASAFF
jgi:hypothetical protein